MVTTSFAGAAPLPESDELLHHRHQNMTNEALRHSHKTQLQSKLRVVSIGEQDYNILHYMMLIPAAGKHILHLSMTSMCPYAEHGRALHPA
eukprot:818881-Pelagomonas_calceolata.AAC.5